MGKDPTRKGPRRSLADETPVDDEMAELAEVIAEHTHDSNAANWFSMPWRDGWNASMLCQAEWSHAIATHEIPPNHRKALQLAIAFEAARARGDKSGYRDFYLAADELRSAHDGFHLDDQRDGLEWIPVATPMMRCALRCMQLVISESHGGGYSFNTFLRMVYIHTSIGTPELVRRWRCMDAIGVFPNFANDGHDRERRAFVTAWDRGLYLAAYSIKPVRTA